MTIVEFLLARIAEDEAAIEGGHIDPPGPDPQWGLDRMRAECQAKRAIVAEWSNDARYPDFSGGYETAIDNVLDCLATVYADHPDYDPAWRVT